MSRKKGSVAEREVAALLCPWWAKAEPKDAEGKPIQFVRTPLSGGWGGPAVRAGFGAAGDLMTTAVRFPFCVEVKRRENWTLDTLVAGKASPVWGWWAQARRAAAEMGKEPLLIFRHNRRPWRAMISSDFLPRYRLLTMPGTYMVEWLGYLPSCALILRDSDRPVMVMLDDLLLLEPKVFLPRNVPRAARAR